jgi:hypothetical protein
MPKMINARFLELGDLRSVLGVFNLAVTFWIILLIRST